MTNEHKNLRMRDFADSLVDEQINGNDVHLVISHAPHLKGEDPLRREVELITIISPDGSKNIIIPENDIV